MFTIMSTKYLIGILLIVTNVPSKSLSLNEQSWIVEKFKKLENVMQKASCQQYIGHGYNYEYMVDIDGLALDNTVVKWKNIDLTYFETHLSIKAAKDGIILLSPTSNPGINDLVFEIGIGIGVNMYSVVRVTKDSSNEVARIKTPYILSPIRYTNFYIIISNDVLTIGREGESPIITYSDERLRRVRYFDMSAWGSIDAKFLYDCAPPTPVH